MALRHEVWVLRHAVNCGQGAAPQTGIDFALARGAEVVITFDAEDVTRRVRSWRAVW